MCCGILYTAADIAFYHFGTEVLGKLLLVQVCVLPDEFEHIKKCIW